MPDKKRPGPYPAEFKERAVRMVLDHQGEYPTLWKAVQSISAKLDVNHETLRVWVLRAETDAGKRPLLPHVKSSARFASLPQLKPPPGPS